MTISNQLFAVFVSCEDIESRAQTSRPRGLSKPEVSRLSFLSLWRTLNNSGMRWRLAASDNNSSTAFRRWMQRYYSTRGKRADGTRLPVPVYATSPEPGNVPTETRHVIDILDKLHAGDNDWLLIAEDDQLFAIDAVWLMFEFLNTYEGDFCLCPYCQPYRVWLPLAERESGPQIIRPYLATIAEAVRTERPRLVLRTRLHHWMQTWHSNGTMIVRVGLYRQWWQRYKCNIVHAQTAEIFETTPCFTPIPSLSTHFQEGCQSPGFAQRCFYEWLENLKQNPQED